MSKKVIVTFEVDCMFSSVEKDIKEIIKQITDLENLEKLEVKVEE